MKVVQGDLVEVTIRQGRRTYLKLRKIVPGPLLASLATGPSSFFYEVSTNQGKMCTTNDPLVARNVFRVEHQWMLTGNYSKGTTIL